eukprot:jgi/Hompol1/5287/HPOL_002648-RA
METVAEGASSLFQPSKPPPASDKATAQRDRKNPTSAVNTPRPGSAAYVSTTPGQARPQASTPETTTTDLHETAEYKVALELELWRQEEETRFRKYLQDREVQLNTQLAAEWKLREREREAILKRKLSDYKTLETQLQRLSNDLESRERSVEKQEHDLERRAEEMDREMKRKLDEARDATRRLQDEFRHRVEMEKQRSADSESARLKAIRERDEMEAKYKRLDAEMLELKRSISAAPDATVRVDLANALRTNTELTKLVETLKKSKNHYKTQLRRTFAELVKQRQAFEDLEKLCLEKDRKAVEQMRFELAAKEQLGFVKDEKRSLETVRKDLDALGHAMMASSGNQQQPLQSISGPTGGGKVPFGDQVLPSKDPMRSSLASFVTQQYQQQTELRDPNVALQIDRLLREKESLLSTGCYVPDDQLIREFDNRIAGLRTAHVA